MDVDLAKVWHFFDCICGKRFAAAIKDSLALAVGSGGLAIPSHVQLLLRSTGIIFTRSRENKKNDNCYAECRKDSANRVHPGYARFAGEEARSILTEVYRFLCPLMNHFYPSMRFKEKIRIGPKVRKRYDRPLTPFQRHFAHPSVSEEVKAALRREHESLDVIALSRGLDVALDKLRAYSAHHTIGLRDPMVAAPSG